MEESLQIIIQYDLREMAARVRGTTKLLLNYTETCPNSEFIPKLEKLAIRLCWVQKKAIQSNR